MYCTNFTVIFIDFVFLLFLSSSYPIGSNWSCEAYIVLPPLSYKVAFYSLAERLDLLSAVMLQLAFLFFSLFFSPLCLFHLQLSNPYYSGTLLRVSAVLKAQTVGGIIYRPLWFQEEEETLPSRVLLGRLPPPYFSQILSSAGYFPVIPYKKFLLQKCI